MGGLGSFPTPVATLRDPHRHFFYGGDATMQHHPSPACAMSMRDDDDGQHATRSMIARVMRRQG
jgi:hypothetical protein